MTRPRREDGHDWAIVRLGVPGIIEEIIIDTSHDTGNYPPGASVEACVAPHNALVSELQDWVEIVSHSDLSGDRRNTFQVHGGHRFTHVRLNIFPDGGVSRLRVIGQPVPNWMAPGQQTGVLDLAALVNGGHVHSASDMHYGDRQNLVMPREPQSVDLGWQTKRRRGSGNDWAVARLAGPGQIHSLTLDTAHFRDNCPAQASLDASCSQDPGDDDWFELLSPQTMIGDTEHSFRAELQDNTAILWVRLNIFPDGGMARLRVWGTLSEQGFTQARLLYLNSSRPSTLRDLFKEVCHSEKWAEEMSRSAPFTDLNDLLKKGARAWSKCSEPDWKQALDGHPRIGSKAKGRGLSAQWSKGEQSKAQVSDTSVTDKLQDVQEQYFQKFKFIFLICASGRSSEEILAAAQARLQNSAPEELQTVAEEQAKIIHLRLEKLLT